MQNRATISDDYLAQQRELHTHIGFFSVHTGLAVKTFPDGRNAHIIQQPTSLVVAQAVPALRDRSFAAQPRRLLNHRRIQKAVLTTSPGLPS